MSGKTKEMLERELDEALDEVEELHERLDSILEIAGAEEEDRLESDDVDGLLERLDSIVERAGYEEDLSEPESDFEE